MSKLDIMYMFPNTPEPRNENIVNLVKHEYKTGIMYWKKTPEKEVYTLDDCNVYEVSVRANDHNPLKRIFPTIKYYKKALRLLKEKTPKCIHVSKVDSMFLAWFYKVFSKVKPYIIYDISDLHTLAYNDNSDIKSRIIRKVLWKVEKLISKQVDYILITSPKFFDEYYNAFYDKDQVLFVPNAPDVSCFEGFQKKESGKYTLGFVGSVRYYDQMTKLIDVSKELDVNVLIAGSGEAEQKLREYAKRNENVTIYGKYDYKTEIRSLYEKIDCVYALYDTSIKNVRVALPNKLYEGAFCGLPFIASKGVYVAEIIEKYGFGIAAEDGNIDDLKLAINKVKSLSNEKVLLGCEHFSKENSFEENSRKLVSIYKELLSNS